MKIVEFDDIVEPNDQTIARREHLDKLREIVGNVYPNKFDRSSITGREDTITNVVSFGPVAEILTEIREHIATLEEGQRPDKDVKEALNEKLKELGTVRIAGRLAVPPRVMGKAAFVHLSDGVERLQIYVRKQDAVAISNDTGKPIEQENAAWEVFGLLDHGDFIGVSGYLFLTNTGELSVHVETLQFLSKAMVPMPDKMHGIADPELQRRFRYADLIASSLQIEHEGLTTRQVFERRAKLITGFRRFLDDAGFIEVETPMLTPKATGAAAKPFETHHNALDIPLYARIAPELYLKRLTVGGFEKVYELNRNFRNEGISQKHNPEFTMLEFYCAYMDVNGMMDFAEAMIKEAVAKANGGSLQLKIKGFLPPFVFDESMVQHDKTKDKVIDFSNFQRLTMRQSVFDILPQGIKELIGKENHKWMDVGKNVKVLSEFLPWFHEEFFNLIEETDSSTGETIRTKSDEEAHLLIEEKWNELNNNPTPNLDENEVATELLRLFEGFVEENLGIVKNETGYSVYPTFIIDYPKSISPLSKASPTNPNIAERFELFINGMEVANGFSELNDPEEQYERFVDQMSEREGGDEEAMVLDEDYIKALSYGMPPAAGIGIGIDRLVMLLTNKHSIRDVILFPHMRPEKRETEDN